MANLPSDHRATIIEVARRARVSITTVSRVINGATPVAEDTAARVWAAVAELNFTPQAAARNLASKKTNTIGLLIPEISGSFFPPMLRGIEACAQENGFDLLIYANPDPTRIITKNTRPLGQHNTDGLIIFTDCLDKGQILTLYEKHFPMVLMHRTPPASLDIPCITIENKAGARKLVDHLIETHHYSRIAFLLGPDGNEDSDWRFIGYRDSLLMHDIPYDPKLVGQGGFDVQEAQPTVEKWLKENLKIDAIFAGDDESAAGVYIALERAGKRIPEDIAVVGFDDDPLDVFLKPPLTTVRAPIEAAGWNAASQLINLIQTGNAEALILLPTDLVVRRSCGCRM